MCVAFNPQSTIVATGSMDTTAKLWDVQKGAEVSTLSVSISILHYVIPVCTNVCFAIVIINGMITVGTLTLHCCTKWCSHCEWSLANLALLPVCVCNCLTHRVILQRLYLVHSTQLVINYWLAHLITLWVCGTQEQAGKRKKTFAYKSSLSPLG